MTGLYYMRARYYDPELGRFLTEDPLGIAGGLNLYAYAGNDPINNRDPYGLCHDESEEEEPSGARSPEAEGSTYRRERPGAERVVWGRTIALLAAGQLPRSGARRRTRTRG